MTVEVTARHIADGKREHSRENPIALALRESDRFATVTNSKVHLLAGVADLPHSARVWLSDFNRARSVNPFTLTAWPA